MYMCTSHRIQQCQDETKLLQVILRNRIQVLHLSFHGSRKSGDYWGQLVAVPVYDVIVAVCLSNFTCKFDA
jgi:hypothetical protein